MSAIKKYKTAVILILLSAVVLISGCKLYKEETSQISGLDEQACEALGDTISVAYTAKVLTDYNAAWLNTNVSTFADTLLDSLLQDSIVVEQESIHPYEIELPGANDTSYVAVKVSPGKRVFFLTNFVDVLPLTAQGQPIDFISDEMPLTTVSGCTIEDSKGQLSPHIKMRLAYEIGAETFLLVLKKNDQTAIDTEKKVATLRFVIY